MKKKIIDKKKEPVYTIMPIKDKFKEHSKHHSKKHIDTMKLLVKNKLSFDKAHMITQKLVGNGKKKINRNIIKYT